MATSPGMARAPSLWLPISKKNPYALSGVVLGFTFQGLLFVSLLYSLDYGVGTMVCTGCLFSCFLVPAPSIPFMFPPNTSNRLRAGSSSESYYKLEGLDAFFIDHFFDVACWRVPAPRR